MNLCASTHIDVLFFDFLFTHLWALYEFVYHPDLYTIPATLPHYQSSTLSNINVFNKYHNEVVCLPPPVCFSASFLLLFIWGNDCMIYRNKNPFPYKNYFILLFSKVNPVKSNWSYSNKPLKTKLIKTWFCCSKISKTLSQTKVHSLWRQNP